MKFYKLKFYINILIKYYQNMAFLFGKKKEEKKVDIKATIFLLKDAISSLEKRRDFIQNNMDREKTNAKEWMKKGIKDKALLHMKKFKLYEREANMIDGNIYNLETQRLTIESFMTSNNIIEVMKQASQVLRQGPNPDQVSDLVEEINDSMQNQQEIAEELSRPIGPVMDEDELLSELGELEAEELDKIVKKEVKKEDLPKVPVLGEKINIDEKINNNVNDELKELELLMS